MLVVRLVLSRLDYSNDVLVGIPAHLLRRLQSVLNAAARLIMAALWNRADHYIFILFLFFLSSFFFSRLISAVRDWMSTILPQMVWP